MKIFLVYPVFNCSQDTGYCYGLGYISAMLKQSGYQTEYIDLKNANDISNFYNKIKIEKPDVIAFSIVSMQFNYVKKMIDEISQFSLATIILGGMHPTLKPECIFEIQSDVILIRGEGEYAILDVVNALQNNQNVSNIKNCWIKKSDNIVKNDLRPLIENLDVLPFPDKSFGRWDQIIREKGNQNRFIFSRGCIFQCTYCSNKALSTLYETQYFRFHSPEKSIEMILADEQKIKFNSIAFDDDTISLNQEWFYKFFELYRKHFRYPFRCNLRVGTVNSDMMKLLKECNAQEIGIGIEHGNEKFRKEVLNRNISNQEIIETFALCDKYGISHSDFIMVGFPYETKELFLDTVSLCRRVKARGNIAIFNPYPATKLGVTCEINKWIPEKDFFRERDEAVINFPTFNKNDIQLCHDIFRILLDNPQISLNQPFENIVKQCRG
jgi:anaerobic magnesium-protoporphyrin IX monomethyl ester cyclase